MALKQDFHFPPNILGIGLLKHKFRMNFDLTNIKIQQSF